MKHYYTYIMANKRNGTIYIGVTGDLARRVAEHKLGQIPGFTKKYGLSILVWYEAFTSIHEALSAEKYMKKWRRERKIELIEELNPLWNDLSDFSISAEKRFPF